MTRSNAYDAVYFHVLSAINDGRYDDRVSDGAGYEVAGRKAVAAAERHADELLAFLNNIAEKADKSY